MRILYTGPFRFGSVTESRRQGLIELGHEVIGLDQVPYLDRGPSLARKLQMHSLLGPGINAYNRDILTLARNSRPELVYIDVGSYLWPRTIEALRACGAKLVHYTSDYLGFRGYFYRYFFPAVRLYDAHVISQTLCRPILERHGARRIVMTHFGYDPLLHVPSKDGRFALESDAVFVGHWEPSTEYKIAALRKAGVQVCVWGSGWWRAWSLADRRSIRPLSWKEYSPAISAAKLGLCFLSRWNRNKSAGRTFEIPAIGTFLLAERTDDHASYFKEGVEAEFFDGADELISKARRYLSDKTAREAVAAAGHKRCLSSGYSQRERIGEILASI